MKFDLAAAVSTNARLLGIGSLPQRTQERIAVLLAEWQDERGIEADGAYDSRTERSLNDVLAAMGVTSASVPILGPQGFTSAEVVERARHAAAYAATHDVPYKLGGGAAPSAPHPFADEGNRYPGHCDCSGLVHWCWGTKRGNYNTDGLVNDAYKRSDGRFLYDSNGKKRRGPEKLVVGVEPDDLRPGDALVFAGKDEDHDGQREAPGHCCIVVKVQPGVIMYVDGWADDVECIHCRWKLITKYGGSVRVTSAAAFDLARTVALRCKRVRYS